MRLIRCQRGSSAVEFAMIVLPLMLLLFGGIEVGRLMWMRNALQQTSMATARCMALRQTACATGGALDVAKSVLYARRRAAGYSVSIPASAVVANGNASCSAQSNFAVVKITGVFTTGVPLLRQALGTRSNVITRGCFPNQS